VRSAHPFARAPRRRLVWPRRFPRARSRVSLPAIRVQGRRDRRCVRSTSALRNRSTRTPVRRRFPAQRPRSSGDPFQCRFEDRVPLFPEPVLRPAPRSTTRTSIRVLLGSSEDARGRHPRARGRQAQTRLGRIALHGAVPTSARGRSRARALSSLVFESIPRASDTLVAFSVLVSVGCHAVARGPPRSVPRGPRERRAHSRSRVSSVVSRHSHPVPGRSMKRNRVTILFAAAFT
jgi:hypothetical protein